MKHWQQYNSTEQLQILDITSAETNLPRLAIEKDWWVTMTLKALSNTQFSHLMSFKGGTSLSKGWRLIDRFSEDIDIALKREDRFAISGTSNSQLAKARRTARHYIIRELPDDLQASLSSFDISDFSIESETGKDVTGKTIEMRADTHPSVIYISYNSIVPETSEYVQPKVKIEISCLSMDEPVEEKQLRSLISESVKDIEDITAKFMTVIPTRTFLEKIFLLHEEFQREKPRNYRMSRHLYDLEKIMDSEFGANALTDRSLYNDIVRHRSIFNKIPSVDYNTHQPSSISFIPPSTITQDWANDYQSMREDFIYEQDCLSFENLITRMEELQDRIRKV